MSVHQYMIAWLYVYAPRLGLPAYICVFASVSVPLCVCVYVCMYVWCLPLCGHLLCVYVMTVSPCVWLSVCLCVFQCIKSYVCVLVSLPMCACPMHI